VSLGLERIHHSENSAIEFFFLDSPQRFGIEGLKLLGQALLAQQRGKEGVRKGEDALGLVPGYHAKSPKRKESRAFVSVRGSS